MIPFKETKSALGPNCINNILDKIHDILQNYLTDCIDLVHEAKTLPIYHHKGGNGLLVRGLQSITTKLFSRD